MNKQEAEALRAQSRILAKELGIDRAVRRCIEWMVHVTNAGASLADGEQSFFHARAGTPELQLTIVRGPYQEAVTVRLLVGHGDSVPVYKAWRKSSGAVSTSHCWPVTIVLFKPGAWVHALLVFAEECREALLKLKQEQEQERIEQMVNAFAPMEDWEGING